MAVIEFQLLHQKWNTVLKNNIPMLFNIGGKKTMSSSDIARNLLDQATK